MSEIESMMRRGIEKRLPLFSSADTDCFRIINGEGDGLEGLTVDRFGGYLLVQAFDRSIVEEAGEDLTLRKDYRDALLGAAGDLPVEIKGVLFKNREKLKGSHDFISERRSTLVEGEYPPGDFTVVQNGVNVIVDLVEGQSTGIFLDMREVRDFLGGFYGEHRCETMLNLFCYTALFSVHALKNGLKHACNVDLSRAVLKRARENYILNGLAVDDRDFIYGDSIEWIKRLKKKNETYSIAVIDPPTFSRNRKKVFSVKEDYGKTVAALEALVPQGYVLSAVNTVGVSEKEYLSWHPSRWEMIMYRNESSDFRAGGNPYLKVGLWKTGW